MSSVTVVKLGGSVLTNPEAYRHAAGFVGTLAASAPARVVAVVSAEHGHTDELFDEARQLTATPDPDVLALLWSTGELRSVGHEVGVIGTLSGVRTTLLICPAASAKAAASILTTMRSRFRAPTSRARSPSKCRSGSAARWNCARRCRRKRRPLSAKCSHR